MSWVSLTIEIDAAHAEILSDALFEQKALSVDIHDAAEGTSEEQILFGEPGSPTGEIWRDAEVTALFPQGVNIPAIMQAVTRAAELPNQPRCRVVNVEEQDWVRLTQSQFDPIQISSRLWIVPTWHEAPDSSAINLILDPGLAFGTGSHPTTKLCLSWLDKNLQPNDSVIDYGCGSGILAIAALKLGASHVVGVDIDEHAVTASHENAARNTCDFSKIHFASTHRGLDASVSKSVDIVVANILANPLIMLAPILANAARSGGRIILSGILEAQADEVLTMYRQWFNMRIAEEQEGWVLLTGTKICI